MTWGADGGRASANLTDDYLKHSASCQVDGIVWYEFLSADPVKKAQWAQHLGEASRLPQSMVVLADFLDPALDDRLKAYAALPNVVAVREHLGWDTGNALRRFAKRPDLLTDSAWRKGVGTLQHHGFKCVIELFAPQLRDLPGVVRLYPDIGFTVAVMGWPLDLGEAGYAQWRHELAVLRHCENVCVEIAAIECLFGMGWRQEQVAPWLLSVIDIFGPSRCMFGSHLPIASLSAGFERLYHAYQEIVTSFSAAEQDDMFRGTVAAWFKPR